DAGYRDDGLEARDPGGRDAVGDGGVPALADHAGAAVGPARGDGSASLTGGVGAPAAVQPVDHGPGRLDVGAAADVDAAVGAIGSGQIDQDRGIAAGNEVVVVEKG